MKKLQFIASILLVASTMACESVGETSDKKSQEKASADTAEEASAESDEESAESESSVEDDRNLLSYAIAQEKWTETYGLELPENIDVKAVYEEIGPCDFYEILKSSGNYVLTRFYTGTDVENNYYITFDGYGNLIDLVLYGTISYGVDFEASFIADNIAYVINSNQQGFDIDDEGNDSFDHLHVNSEYYYIEDDGNIRTLNNTNQAAAISELSPELFDYYEDAIKTQRPGKSLELFPFSIIPGNNEASTTDVYESLEGGGMYANCLEVRAKNNDLIGLVGYKYDPMMDSIPDTYSMILSKQGKPIIDYSIVSIDGRLFTEVITQELSVETDFLIAKTYYAYPMQNKNASVPQAPKYAEVGSIKDMLSKPLDLSTAKTISK